MWLLFFVCSVTLLLTAIFNESYMIMSLAVALLTIFVAMLFIYSNEKSYSFVGTNTLSITKSVNVLVCVIMVLTLWSGICCFTGVKNGKSNNNAAKKAKRAKKN